MQLQNEAYEYKLTTWSEKRKLELNLKRIEILSKQAKIEEGNLWGFREAELSRVALSDVDYLKYSRKFQFTQVKDYAFIRQTLGSSTTYLLIRKEEAEEKFEEELKLENLDTIFLGDLSLYSNRNNLEYKDLDFKMEELEVKIKANAKGNLKYVGDKPITMSYSKELGLVIDIGYAYWFIKNHEKNPIVQEIDYKIYESKLNLLKE